jgi:hypothetical protein
VSRNPIASRTLLIPTEDFRYENLRELCRLVLEYDRTGGIAEEPERAAHWLLDGGPEMGAVTPDDLRDLFVPLVDRLLG